jgi:two-component system, OmpR family, aerobic respiration control sensor histidine kinase ArcB
MEFYKQLILDSPNPIYVKNEEGAIILANEAFADLHNISLETLLNQGTLNIDFSQKRDSDLIKTGDSATFEEYFKLKDGKKVWFNTIKKPTTGPKGEKWLVSTSSDITEIKKGKGISDQSAKSKYSFQANVSHEIRTLLNGIHGMVSLMNKTTISPQQKKYLDFIHTNADNLLLVLNEIVGYSNVEIGNIIQEKQPFDVVAQVKKIVADFENLAVERELKLSLDNPKIEFPIIEGDPHLLSEILKHLFRNAFQFTRKGSIKISLEKQEAIDDKILISFCVEDTGIGIPPDKLIPIFESFNQEYTSSRKSYGRAELGLSRCKKLVELQGGKFWTENVSEGSKFCLTLPYKISIQKDIPSKKASFETQNIKGLSILLAEDNKINQFLALSFLELIDAKVDLAHDGEEALAKSKEKKYDLILMDIRMPFLNGFEVTKKIRQEKNKNKSSPIIAMTADILNNNRETFNNAGITDFLAKPYNETELFHLIALHTGKKPIDEKSKAELSIPQTLNSEEPLYDFTNLGILGTDEEFLKEMKILFIETIPPQIDLVDKAVQAHDWAAMPGLTHNLKSTLGNIGINKAVKRIKKIDELALEGKNVKEMNELIEQLRSLINRVIEAFLNDLKN